MSQLSTLTDQPLVGETSGRSFALVAISLFALLLIPLVERGSTSSLQEILTSVEHRSQELNVAPQIETGALERKVGLSEQRAGGQRGSAAFSPVILLLAWIAVACTLLLYRLYIRQQAALVSVERAERRSRYLSEASQTFAASLDHGDTVRSLVHLAVPELAAACVIYSIDQAEQVYRVDPALTDPDLQALRPGLLTHHPLSTDSLSAPLREALLSGKTRVLHGLVAEELGAGPERSEHFGDFGESGLQSVLFIPLRARNRILGAVGLGSRKEGGFGPEEVAVAEALVNRAALAMDNALLYQASRSASQARDVVMQVVSHDLRSPAHAVTVGTQALLRHWPPLDDGRAERTQLEAIALAANQMLGLTRDLIDVARIEARQLRLEIGPVNAADLVDPALVILQPLAEKSGITLENHVPDTLPQIHADHDRIRRIFCDLVENVIEHTPAGGRITIHATGERTQVRFVIADSGTGRTRDDLPHLFDQFWKLQRNRRGEAALSLAITKRVVEELGGQIWAETTAEAGNMILFTLPIAQIEKGDHEPVVERIVGTTRGWNVV